MPIPLPRRMSLALALLAAGCAAPQAKVQQPAVIRPAAPRYSPAGLDAVIGRTAGHLEAMFGRAELDVREGSARKLQFTGPVCVLDAYLYPPKGTGEPIVSYLDARLPDGRDIDRASCVSALQQQKKTG